MNPTLNIKPDILPIISAAVALRKQGRSYVGLCPFHDEKTPSFSVSPEKQSFHCFGCAEHGDVIDFIQKSRGVSFKEALSILGIDKGTMPKVDPQREHRRQLLKAYERWKRVHYDRLCRKSIRLHKIIMTVEDNPVIPEALAWKVAEETSKLPKIEHYLDVFLSYDESAIFEIFMNEEKNNV